MKQVILTGLRANNDLHIGNYLGALLPLIDMANTKSEEFQINLFVPDLHSFTTPVDHSLLSSQIMQNLGIFVAAGLNIEHPNVHIYRQSYIPAHSELTWILDCFTGFGEMNRMTQFKDKTKDLLVTEQNEEIVTENGEGIIVGHEPKGKSVSIGLFNYPVLMAADILLYGASYIPVGDDQTQHLEFTRDIAQRMNAKFGDLFVVPKSVQEQHKFFGKEQGLRIKDLVNPEKKMSKSDATGKGVIFLTDSPAASSKKIMSATTDSLELISYNPQTQPGISNLLEMLALLTVRSLEEVTKEYEGQTTYGPLKAAVADAVSTFLIGFQQRFASINEQAILDKLETSEAIMREQAGLTLLNVQKAVGLRA